MRPGRLLATLCLALTALAAARASAESAEERGLAIAVEADHRNDGYGDSSVTLLMILRNKQGEESKREMRARNLEVAGDGDKTLVIFDEPKDVRGTALLTFSHKTADDDRWLFLPALKRVKRIASNNKSGPFMGSEFAYEDIGSQEVEKYTYRYLRDETQGGQDCFVLERSPKDQDSGYTREVVWLDKAEYRALRIEFYDRKGALLKTLELKEYRKYLDRYWRAARFEMVNQQTGKSTTLLFRDFKFRSGFTARDFDQDSLQAVR